MCPLACYLGVAGAGRKQRPSAFSVLRAHTGTLQARGFQPERVMTGGGAGMWSGPLWRSSASQADVACIVVPPSPERSSSPEL